MKRLIIILTLIMFCLGSCSTTKEAPKTDKEPQTLDFQLDKMTNQMVKSLSDKGKRKIAILEFPNLSGQISKLGKFIPEELTTRLFRTQRFEVIERQLVNQVLSEMNFQASGLVAPSSAAEIGKMLGVDAIVSGTITDLGQEIRLNARIIEVESANVFAVSSVTIKKESYLADMMNKFADGDKQEKTNEKTESEPVADTDDKKQTPKPDYPKTIVDGMELKINSVKMGMDNRLIIEFTFTNTTFKDKEVRFGIRKKSWAVIYDSRGYEFIGGTVQVGNKKSGSSLGHLFISDVPTKVTYSFKEVNPEMKLVKLFKFKIWHDSNGEVTFRDMPVIR